MKPKWHLRLKGTDRDDPENGDSPNVLSMCSSTPSRKGV